MSPAASRTVSGIIDVTTLLKTPVMSDNPWEA